MGEDCNDILEDCMDGAQLNSYKDEQYKNALENIEANIESWDSSKCPAVQRHNDRLIAAEAEKDKGAEDNNAGEQEQSTGEENQEPTASATSLAVSIFSTLVLALLI